MGEALHLVILYQSNVIHRFCVCVILVILKVGKKPLPHILQYFARYSIWYSDIKYQYFVK